MTAQGHSRRSDGSKAAKAGGVGVNTKCNFSFASLHSRCCASAFLIAKDGGRGPPMPSPPREGGSARHGHGSDLRFQFVELGLIAAAPILATIARFGPLCGLKSDTARGPRSAKSGHRDVIRSVELIVQRE